MLRVMMEGNTLAVKADVGRYQPPRTASGAGLAAATSMVQICAEELDGSILDRDIARVWALRIVRAYLDQAERVLRQAETLDGGAA